MSYWKTGGSKHKLKRFKRGSAAAKSYMKKMRGTRTADLYEKCTWNFFSGTFWIIWFFMYITVTGVLISYFNLPYWVIEKKGKLTKKQIKLAHKQARRLMKHKDRIKTPYALATWQVEKGEKIKQ